MDTQFYKKRAIWVPLLVIGIAGIITLIVVCSNTCDTFILPDGFTGKVTVIYAPSGTPPNTTSINTTRTFNIPASGVLVVPFPPRRGIVSREFYYKKRNANPLLLPEQIDYHMPNIWYDSVRVDVEGFGKPDTLKYGNNATAFRFEIVKLK